MFAYKLFVINNFRFLRSKKIVSSLDNNKNFRNVPEFVDELNRVSIKFVPIVFRDQRNRRLRVQMEWVQVHQEVPSISSEAFSTGAW